MLFPGLLNIFYPKRTYFHIDIIFYNKSSKCKVYFHIKQCFYSGRAGSIAVLDTKNFLLSSNYDLETAEYMHKSRRYVYVIFMCHITIEKVLKVFSVKGLLKTLIANPMEKEQLKETFLKLH